MIEVKFKDGASSYGIIPGAVRTIDADNVNIHEGWATFEKYVDMPGEKPWKDAVFVEAIRSETIESMRRL